MAKVLSISSQTVYGPVGNSAAVPAMQALGHEVMQIPTVLLSNHPGLGVPVGQATLAAQITATFEALNALGAFHNLAGVMTGYFKDAAQVIAVAKQITTLKEMNHTLHVLVDPVIGDHGKLYVGQDVAESIRDVLLPLATITTPNVFELSWLTQMTDVAAAVKALNRTETIVTSRPAADDCLMTELHTGGEVLKHSIRRRNNVPHGTGDYLAGCYLSERLHHHSGPAFHNAMMRLEHSIAASEGRAALKVN